MSDQTQQRQHWETMCHQVVEKMLEHVAQFVTPISKVISHEHGEAWGTGSYIELNSRRFLITNEHVARKLKSHSIGHQFCGNDSVVRCVNPMVALPAPEDVAVALIEEDVWNICQHQAATIPCVRFAPKHAPVDGELLFMAGYSGERSFFSYGTLVSPGTPYLTQEVKMPATEGDPAYHFALYYLPDKATSTEERARGLPDPHGFSGSLIWNTRFAEVTTSGGVWKPEDAVITGILWGWPSGEGCLIATRVEHLPLRAMTQVAVAEAQKLRASKTDSE